MDSIKIYVLTKETHYGCRMSSKSILKFSFHRYEMEFAKWKAEQILKTKEYQMSSMSYSFNVEEVDSISIGDETKKSKDFKKFVKEQVADFTDTLEQAKSLDQSTGEVVKRVEQELDFYKSL